MTALRWTSTRIAEHARKRHEEWVAATDPVDETIAHTLCALAWRQYKRAEVEESERPTWPRISIREIIR
jgi:hypothetical protein